MGWSGFDSFGTPWWVIVNTALGICSTKVGGYVECLRKYWFVKEDRAGRIYLFFYLLGFLDG